MPYFTYDTSVCVSRKLADFQEMPESLLMSAVVLMELQPAPDFKAIQRYCNATIIKAPQFFKH